MGRFFFNLLSNMFQDIDVLLGNMGKLVLVQGYFPRNEEQTHLISSKAALMFVPSLLLTKQMPRISKLSVLK